MWIDAILEGKYVDYSIDFFNSFTNAFFWRFVKYSSIIVDFNFDKFSYTSSQASHQYSIKFKWTKKSETGVFSLIFLKEKKYLTLSPIKEFSFYRKLWKNANFLLSLINFIKEDNIS